ncbi:MAG: inorganic phosphate transporter, partial [bacterium]|nr:inorganic phosphate transporter [bacterium]
ARTLFPLLAVLAMVAMAFAFGQNDLANCASPGLATWALIDTMSVEIGTKTDIPLWALFGCGLLLVAGMGTKNAERVTRAEVAAGSMSDHVGLWAPRWCIGVAGFFLRYRGRAPSLAPRATIDDRGKTMHYDSLRACVILSVSASVIATASGLKLPVSTTYVAFAAVVATGMADRIFQRGDATLKLARSVWVVFSWFASAAIAATASGLVCAAVWRLGTIGLAGGLGVSAVVWFRVRRRADRHAKHVEDEAYERAHPEEFAPEEE